MWTIPRDEQLGSGEPRTSWERLHQEAVRKALLPRVGWEAVAEFSDNGTRAFQKQSSSDLGLSKGSRSSASLRAENITTLNITNLRDEWGLLSSQNKVLPVLGEMSQVWTSSVSDAFPSSSPRDKGLHQNE